MTDQPCGYDFEVVGKPIKENTCPICQKLIRETVELPCTHIMCKACLINYEDKRVLDRSVSQKKPIWKNSIRRRRERYSDWYRERIAGFRCFVCNSSYGKSEKIAVRSMDRIIRESFDVKCKQWKQTCKWSGSISNYEDHHIKLCKFIIVECKHEGCGKTDERKNIPSHEVACGFYLVHCPFCDKQIRRNQLEQHHEIECPSYPVECRNVGCEEEIERDKMDLHCINDCAFEMIECPYQEVGCEAKLYRHQRNEHFVESNHEHSMFLLKNQMKIVKKNEELESALNSSNKRIEELNKTVEKQNDTIKKQQDMLDDVQGEVNKQSDLFNC